MLPSRSGSRLHPFGEEQAEGYLQMFRELGQRLRDHGLAEVSSSLTWTRRAS